MLNIPMKDAVYMVLMRVVKGRTSPKLEPPVDGHSILLSGQVRDA